MKELVSLLVMYNDHVYSPTLLNQIVYNFRRKNNSFVIHFQKIIFAFILLQSYLLIEAGKQL